MQQLPQVCARLRHHQSRVDRERLRAMRRSGPKRDQLLMRVGAAKTEAGRAFGYVKIQLPPAGQAVTRQTFTFQVDKVKLREAQLRDGHYLLRTNLVAEDPAVLWDRYMQLVQVEAAFKSLKSDLGIRPIHHQLEHRVEAHILVAFMAYCLTATLKTPFARACARLDPESRAGQTGGHPGAGCLVADRRRALPGDATPHRAGLGPGAPAAPTAAGAPPTTAAPPHHGSGLRHPSTQNVVQTLGKPPLKTNGFVADRMPNCESRVNSPVLLDLTKRSDTFGNRLPWLTGPCNMMEWWRD